MKQFHNKKTTTFVSLSREETQQYLIKKTTTFCGAVLSGNVSVKKNLLFAVQLLFVGLHFGWRLQHDYEYYILFLATDPFVLAALLKQRKYVETH